jgi:hypothetical protein
MDHEITVARLKELLADLKDDDLLIPNAVRNLSIIRDEKEFGFIDLLAGCTGIEEFGP